MRAHSPMLESRAVLEETRPSALVLIRVSQTIATQQTFQHCAIVRFEQRTRSQGSHITTIFVPRLAEHSKADIRAAAYFSFTAVYGLCSAW